MNDVTIARSRLRAAGSGRRISKGLGTAALAVACGALLFSGCGSRAPLSSIEAAAHRPIVRGSALQADSAGGTSQALGTTGGTSGNADVSGAGGTSTPAASAAGTPTGASSAPAAAAHGTTAPAGAAGGSSTAASHSTISLGNVGTYSGVIGAVFSGAQQTIGVWQAYVNAHGGLNGHPVHVYIEDDGGDPSTSESDVEQEVTQDHVIAFVGNLVPLTASASVSYLQQQDIPVIGGDASSATWWQSLVMFPQGGSDLGDDQAIFTIKGAAARGDTKMGVMYCVEDPTCSDGIQSLIQAGGGQAAGVTTVYSSSFSITQPDFTANCLDAKQAGANFIYFAGDGDSLERMANDCAEQGYKPLFVGDSIAITANLASDPNLNGLLAGQTDFPWVDSYTPAQATYQQAVKAYDPSLASSATTAAEWTAGMLAVAASSALTATPTSAEFFQGLWGIKNNNLGGLAPPLTFTQGQPATPSNCYFMMTLNNGQFQDLNNGTTTCVS
ncbi:MAG TPA: ABC transporter substrate-binding protein [Acidimicrobiales bacterium]|nr:ABC transporter substrate-binding protein [Acidimicrobiales bacterium]